MRSEYNAPPSRERLLQRLRQLGQEVQDDATADELAHVINQCLCDQAVCSAAVVDGKSYCMKFCTYWEHVFQKKWVYVPHGERVRPASELKGVMK